MFYGFFDYKGKLKAEGFESDLFSAQHLCFIVLVFVLTFAASYLLRKTKREKIDVFLKIFSICMVFHEVSKLCWESYYDITTGAGFNWGGLLPLYTCSLFIYTLLAAAWCGGKAKEYALSFITTVGLLYGGVGVVYCNGLNFYPFWTFGAFYSLFFHASMFSIGVFLLVTGYKRLEWRDVFRSFVPIVLLALIAVPVNYILNDSLKIGADYMLLYSGDGVPLYQDLSGQLAEKGLRFVYTIIMLVTHLPLAALIIGIYKLVRAFFTRHADARPE